MTTPCSIKGHGPARATSVALPQVMPGFMNHSIPVEHRPVSPSEKRPVSLAFGAGEAVLPRLVGDLEWIILYSRQPRDNPGVRRVPPVAWDRPEAWYTVVDSVRSAFGRRPSPSKLGEARAPPPVNMAVPRGAPVSQVVAQARVMPVTHRRRGSLSPVISLH